MIFNFIFLTVVSHTFSPMTSCGQAPHDAARRVMSRVKKITVTFCEKVSKYLRKTLYGSGIPEVTIKRPHASEASPRIFVCR